MDLHWDVHEMLIGCFLLLHLLHLLLVRVDNVRVFFLVLHDHQRLLQALLRHFVVIGVPAHFRSACRHQVVLHIKPRVHLQLLGLRESLKYFAHLRIQNHLECLRVLQENFLQLLLVEVVGIYLLVHHLVVLVCLRCELDVFYDFLCEELLLPLITLLLEDLIKSVFDVLGKVEKLHAKLLDQNVILALRFRGHRATCLVGEQVLD